MKLAVGLIAIFLSLFVMLQSCTIAAGGGLTENRTFAEAGSLGLLVGLLYFLGGAFAFGLPMVSAVIFTLGGVIALAISGDFKDMSIWGYIALALAVMSFFAWRSARKAKAAASGGVSK